MVENLGAQVLLDLENHHNFAWKEKHIIGGVEREVIVHRKGATRAFPAQHFALKGTPFYDTGHPILLPGNPEAGSVVMVAEPGAAMPVLSKLTEGPTPTIWPPRCVRW